MLIIDRKFLYKQLIIAIIKYTFQSIRVRDIENIYFLLLKYAILKLFVNDSLNNASIRKKLQRQMHIVNNLKINMLIELNILDSQKMHLDYEYKQLILDNCKEMFVSIKVILIKNKINQVIRTFTTITILLYSNTIISIRLRKDTQLSQNCDFIFVSYQQTSNCFDFENKILFYVINVNLSIMQVNNTLDQFIKIDKNSRLNSLQEYEKESYYIVVSKNSYLVVNFNISTRF